MNVIDLSNLYSLSLDDLLKGDDKMIEHLEENTNIVKSNRKLIAAIMFNVLLVIREYSKRCVNSKKRVRM
nr:hypothetical protein [[Clostridium] innocuum]